MKEQRVENKSAKKREIRFERAMAPLSNAELMSNLEMASSRGGSSTKEAEKWLKALGPGQP